MKLYHYAPQPRKLLPNQTYPQWLSFRSFSKPEGLWVSVGDAWATWSKENDYLPEGLSHRHEVTLRRGAKILRLKSAKAIFEFSEKYGGDFTDIFGERDGHKLNWEAIKAEYQGIIIAPYQWACRLDPNTLWYYGWDCASGCIWDLSAIKSFTLIP